MNIGFFTNTYLPNIYGLTFSVEMFRKGLELLSHQVYVFAPHYHGYQDMNDRVIRYPSFNWKYKIRYAIPVSFYPPINQTIDRLDLDIVHVHQPFAVARDGLRQGRRLGIPVVYTHHTRYEDYAHYVPVLPQCLTGWHVREAATRFANACDQVIAPSKEIKEMIIQRGVKAPIAVLPTGIDWQRYATGDRQAIRSRYGITQDEVCLLWTGRMEKEKSVDVFVDIAMELARRNQPVKALVVGDGSERAGLEARVTQQGLDSRIHFAGLVAAEEMHHHYAAGDIFLQTSLTETQGMTTTEALASGLAIVAVRATGSNDLIENGKNGLLVDDDKEKIIQALESLLESNERRQALGSQARELAKEMDYREKARELEGMYMRLKGEGK